MLGVGLQWLRLRHFVAAYRFEVKGGHQRRTLAVGSAALLRGPYLRTLLSGVQITVLHPHLRGTLY